MKTGLLLGKFMPVHEGHLALIRFARMHCERLIVLVCAYADEPLPGPLRLQWMQELMKNEAGIEVQYCDEPLPTAADSDRAVSRAWAAYLMQRFPELTHFFSSETYGDYVAEYAGIVHLPFDATRNIVPVSASLIREKPLQYWSYIPVPVRPYFVKRIAIVGPESTGKSTLAAQLAGAYGTVYVREMAREIVLHSEQCSWDDLYRVAGAQARELERCLPLAERLLFADTEMYSTKTYGRHLFGREPDFEPWIMTLNRFDLYLFLDDDLPFEQDGTRLPASARHEMKNLLLSLLKENGISPVIISGTGSARFENAKKAVEDFLKD